MLLLIRCSSPLQFRCSSRSLTPAVAVTGAVVCLARSRHTLTFSDLKFNVLTGHHR
jgi:hypothetical protein